jgi:glycosyltransferase involved in cell wall biosynthesis
VLDHTAELAGGEIALARLLHALDRDAHRTDVLLLADGALVPRLRADGIRVAVLPVSGRLTGVGRVEAASPGGLLRSGIRTLALIPRLSAAIRGAHPDLVVANSLKSAVLAALAAPLAGRPWVWHVHDRIAPDYLPRPMVAGLRLLARIGPRMVVANSLATRGTLPGVPDDRIVVAYPGVDPAGVLPTGVVSTGTSFGLLGRIAPTKGQREFLDAASLVAGSMPEAAFLIIGDALFNDDEFAERIRALPEGLGLAGRVVFTGWVDDPIRAIAGLTALVHASPVPEPFGQVIVEAMLSGVPVIATAAGGVPEILDPESLRRPLSRGTWLTPFGILVAPGSVAALADAMRWMSAHPAERAAIVERARSAAAERFDIASTARTVAAAWDRALDRGPES